jgi:hypothetical protein
MGETSTTATDQRIAVHCDACGRDWRVPATLAGHHGKCTCGHVLIVPHADAPPGTVKCPHCGKWTRPEGWCEWCSEPLEAPEPADLAAVHAPPAEEAGAARAVAPGEEVVARTSGCLRWSFVAAGVALLVGALFAATQAPTWPDRLKALLALVLAAGFLAALGAPGDVVADADGLRWKRFGRWMRCSWSQVSEVQLPAYRESGYITTSVGRISFLSDNRDTVRLLHVAKKVLAAHRVGVDLFAEGRIDE